MTNTPITLSEVPVRREFTVSRDILSTVIRAQAGSLAKGILEGVMNSIDAGAKAIRMTLTKTTLTINDDGKGIANEQELEQYFERFGTKHEAGDGAMFGRFRLGRGQLFTYGVNTWRSTKFEMRVDIGKGDDYGYELSGLLNKIKGCHIHIDLYVPLTDDELKDSIDAVKKLVKFVPSKVYLNGERINKAAEELKNWTSEDELAYYRVLPSTDEAKGVMLYNMGAFVCELPRGDWGVHGVICTKVALSLNSARTEVLYSECSYIRSIQNRLKRVVAESLASATKLKLSKGDRKFVAELVASAVRNNDMYSLPARLLQLKVLHDASDRLLSFQDLLMSKVVAPWCYQSDQDSVAVNTSGRAIVLNAETTDVLQAWSNGALDRLFRGIKNSSKLHGVQELPTVEEVKNLRKGLYTKTTELEDHQVPKTSRVLWALMNALRTVQPTIEAKLMDTRTCKKSRKFVFGDSSASLAWTDGSEYIAFDRKNLLNCAKLGLPGMHQLISLVVHEYCHEESDAESHHHDTLFYSTFHNLLVYSGADFAAAAMAVHDTFLQMMIYGRVASWDSSLTTKNVMGDLVGDLLKTKKDERNELSICDGPAAEFAAACQALKLDMDTLEDSARKHRESAAMALPQMSLI